MIKDNVLISFIVPCYNSAEYMDRCIDSCLNALEVTDSMEIIIVDDGSTKDNTFEIAKEYEKKFFCYDNNYVY